MREGYRILSVANRMVMSLTHNVMLKTLRFASKQGALIFISFGREDSRDDYDSDRCALAIPCLTSTTLADLFTSLPFADLFSAVWASLIWWSKNELDDGVAHGRQTRLWRWAVDPFFSGPLWRCGGAVKRRKRSWS